ncbi:VOC family protein [Heyndrickxia acidicola]|uniref:VOC family protein n=1 Tax=Heyndrickxia acidicola TaxID=209389 RepID=A0ABU6MD38_9BACI|nr:VOC family protein [Heyndrickxia acidicola]MED1202587.1 VOC family protein [Heyndrickxia acidicola]
MQIKEIRLYTNKLNELKNFYSDLLGFSLIYFDQNVISFKVGNSILSFVQTKEITNPYYHFAFNITESKKDEGIAWLKQKGININLINGSEDIFSKSWNSHSIYFYDPSGNILELIARHDLKSDDHKEFKATDIINISEIGFPVNDVKLASDELIQRYNVEVYKESNNEFAPIGNEDGLFILSGLNRNWLGSNKKVEIFPLELTILSCKESEERFLSFPYIIQEKLN